MSTHRHGATATSPRNCRRLALGIATALSALAAPGVALAETADEFVARLNREFADMALEMNAAGWTQATYINVDTQLLNARTYERFLEKFSKSIEEVKKFEGQPMTPASRRAIDLLKQGVSAPAPDDPAKRAELATLLAGMDAKYGSARYCKAGEKECRDEVQLKTVLEESRDYDELLDAWKGWHDQARGCAPTTSASSSSPTRARANSATRTSARCGARATTCRRTSSTREAERLCAQVKPLYEELHCYARARLAQKYGEDKVPAGKPIPAHLFGNMWAQQWNAIYDDCSSPIPA